MLTLTINNPTALGLDTQKENVEQFIDDVILACNLLLKRVVFSKHKTDSARSIISYKEQQSAKVSDTPTGIVNIHENIKITDDVSVSISTRDELDEEKVLKILDKIRKTRSGDAKSELDIHNFVKSLNVYASVIKEIERSSAFRDLFSALELATNCDNGPDRTGPKLDAEASRITGIKQTEIECFRNLSSRLKHKDKTLDQIKEYEKGSVELGKKINQLRKAVQKAIQYRLDKIS